MRVKIITLITSLLTPVITFSTVIMTVDAHAVEAGMYVGGQIGKTNIHNKGRDVQTGTIPPTVFTTPTNTGFGGRVFVGYNFNPYAALEGGFTYYAPSTYKPSITTNCGNPQIRESAFDVVGKGILPIGSFGAFAKAGVAVIRQSASGTLTSTSISNCGSEGTTTSVRPTLGVGVSYDLSQNWVVDASISRVMGTSKIENADLIALGVSYHFVDKYCGQFLC